MVYAVPEVLNKPCVWLARILHKFFGHAKVSRSAHSFLWIYMGLSTVVRPSVTVLACVRACGQGPRVSGKCESAAQGCVKRRLRLSANSCATTKKKFAERTARGSPGLQPKSVYKDSSSVNNCRFLWISRLTDEKSAVYGRYKPVACRCMFLVANLDNNPGRGKSAVSAQTVPVDIKKLIHKRGSGVSFTIW